MPYTRTTWADYPSNIGVTAARMNNIETAIVSLDASVSSANLGQWIDFTPVLAQGAATPNISKTVNYCRYCKVGRLVTVAMSLSITGPGTSGQEIQIQSLPSAITGASASGMCGTFVFLDAGSTFYTGAATGVTTNNLRFYVSSNGNPMGVNPTFAIANGDAIQLSLTYEAAS